MFMFLSSDFQRILKIAKIGRFSTSYFLDTYTLKRVSDLRAWIY